MSIAEAATGILLGAAVALCMMCALGVLVMRDAYQRLNYPAGATGLATVLLGVAVFVADPDAGMRVKMVLIAVILFWTNGVLGHVTGRAVWIREKGRWPVSGKEKMPVEGEGRAVGESKEAGRD